MKIHFVHRVGKYDPLVLNYPVTFVPGSARCSSCCTCFQYNHYLDHLSPQVCQLNHQDHPVLDAHHCPATLEVLGFLGLLEIMRSC